MTLTHAELRSSVSPKTVIDRVKSIFLCRGIAVEKEKHESGGFHYNVGILNKNASRYTATSKFREAFPEFGGAQIYVLFHKSWGTICEYVLKEDENPITWGEISRENLRQTAKAKKDHKRIGSQHFEGLFLSKMKEKVDWYQIYEEEVLARACLSNYSAIRNVHEDLQVIKEMQTTPLERIYTYLNKHGRPDEYDIEYLKEKYLFLDWLA